MPPKKQALSNNGNGTTASVTLQKDKRSGRVRTKIERSDVEFPIWRKKVDMSLFEHNGTTVPNWACRMWNLNAMYGAVSSRRDPAATGSIVFKGVTYPAWITTATKGRRSPAIRLWIDDDLSLQLKRTFVMSYMRSLEGMLEANGDIELQISFWEFLDIEFDEQNRTFNFVAYYTVSPSFPNLFQRLIGSPSLAVVQDELAGKHGARIHKQDWKPQTELEFELGAKNVIYTLLDTDAKLVYVGEAEDLVKRLKQPYSCIPNWNLFRYDVLPECLREYRVTLERMLIRDFAAVLPNKKGVMWNDISKFKLANDKVDG